MRSSFIPVVLLIAIAFFGACSSGVHPKTQDGSADQIGTQLLNPITRDWNSIGRPDAPVAITVFSDFQ